jgi:hypothetical protein
MEVAWMRSAKQSLKVQVTEKVAQGSHSSYILSSLSQPHGSSLQSGDRGGVEGLVYRWLCTTHRVHPKVDIYSTMASLGHP